MTVSGSNDFESSGGQIIQDALLLCNGLEDDETATSEQVAHALRALNRMCKAWSVKGLKAWCWNEITLPLASNQESYTIGLSGADLTAERPLEIRNVRKYISSQETPVRICTRQEYFDQSGKTTDGETVYVYYDPQLSKGVLYVWPSPDSTHELRFSSKQYIEDFDTSNNTPYFPVEWEEAIVYNLALRLCPQYEVDPQKRAEIKEMAREFLMEAEDYDMEQGSIFIFPRMCG